MIEGGCLKAGILRRRLDNDRARVLRRMEVMDIDRILSDSQGWWKIALAWVDNPPQSAICRIFRNPGLPRLPLFSFRVTTNLVI